MENIEQLLPEPSSTDKRRGNNQISVKVYFLLLLFILVTLSMLVAGIFLIVKGSRYTATSTAEDGRISIEEYCQPSEEAKRMKLNGFLEKCQILYFKLYPAMELYFHRNENGDILRTISRKFAPYVPSPSFLKDFADQLITLQKELKALDANFAIMKPKESQIVAEMEVFLDQFMAQVYDVDFYGGDWMLGPNYFCFNRICDLVSDIRQFIYYTVLSTKEDIEFVINTLHHYEATFVQYTDNLELGVKSGMVKSKLSCQAGVDAMKERYGRTLADVNTDFLHLKSKIPDVIQREWKLHHNQTVMQSISSALVKGFKEPVRKFMEYLENSHIRHCPPDDVASGVSSLPLDYVYLDGAPDYSQNTTKVMPLTNENLSGKELYDKILPRFTTVKLSAEEIYEEGVKQLDLFYAQMIDATKAYTNESDERMAVEKMKAVMDGDDQWHGQVPFPANESDENAYRKCNNNLNAAKYCPVRWKSMQKWEDYLYGIMGKIHPKLNNVFHFTGDKRSAPGCPIVMTPHFNPSNGAMFFSRSNAYCSSPARYGVPFFLEKYGPRFQEWSVNGHEARPGHHFQMQGMTEVFPYPCTKDLSSFFHEMGYFTGFIEGWALYGENPVLSHDVNLYEDNLLQKIGMYKWQVWRAVRLIVDTGLHSRKMNRTWALDQFEKYTWDKTDFVRKEITRYMSCPGQATAYMIGRLTILKAREKAERELGHLFYLKDFHYQVLSLGQAPLGYLLQHIDRYISCIKDRTQLYCNYILYPVHRVPSMKMPAAATPYERQWYQKRHYV